MEQDSAIQGVIDTILPQMANMPRINGWALPEEYLRINLANLEAPVLKGI